MVYRAAQDTNDVLELYSVPLDGSSAPVKLNGALVLGGNVGTFQVSPDSTRAVYQADQDTDQVGELYASQIVPVATAIENLLDLLDALVDDGTLTPGQANGLRQPLLNAQQSLDQGKTASACSQVQDFIDEVNQKVADGVLPQAEADVLIDLATALQVALACSL